MTLDTTAPARAAARGPSDGTLWTTLPVFQGLDDDAVARMHSLMEPVSFDDGAEILRQGERGDDLYVLSEGRIRVRAQTSMRDTLFERILKAPAVFGEMAVVTHEPRTATVLAEGPVRGYRLDAEAVNNLVTEQPRSAALLTSIVGRRLLEADTIATVGKYEVTGRLGSGAMATVFQAVQPDLGRTVALKMMSHALVKRPGFLEHFKREGQLVAQLDHDNIVRVHDTVEAYGTHFIVMEKLTGNSLDELVKDKVRLDWDSVRRILREILLALEYSHSRDLLHRDIKPSNVFLGANRRVKLLDFGIAVRQGASEVAGGRLMGTPYYMAPEQIRGRKLDGRTDLYATGILAYELVTHRVPFDAKTLQDLLDKHLKAPTPDPRRRVKDVPPDLVDFIRRSTAKRRQDRFSTCGEAASFLQLASERPMVERFDVAHVAIAFHPSRRSQVMAELSRLEATLEALDGVKLNVASTRSES